MREGERSRQVSKQRAVLKTIVTRTLKGDARAANLLLSTMMRLLDTGEGTPEVAEPLHDDELEILRDFKERLRRDEAGAVTDPSEADDSPEETS